MRDPQAKGIFVSTLFLFNVFHAAPTVLLSEEHLPLRASCYSGLHRYDDNAFQGPPMHPSTFPLNLSDQIFQGGGGTSCFGLKAHSRKVLAGNFSLLNTSDWLKSGEELV